MLVSGGWSEVGGIEHSPLLSQEELWKLPQDKLKEIVKVVSHVRKVKYNRRKIRKYGNLNKGFTEEELKKFFKFCYNPKAKLCFQLMAYLGLRVGEVVEISLNDVDFKSNKIKINTEKANTTDYLYLHNKVRILLKDWVRKHLNTINKNEGFLFYSDNAKRDHISKDWLRKEFRIVRKRADLDESYGIAEDINNPNKWKIGKRKLYRLSTHSLRHYYITKVYDSCKDPIKTQKLARHLDFKSTQTYIHTKQEEVDQTLKEVFENEKASFDKRDIQDFVNLFKAWKETN